MNALPGNILVFGTGAFAGRVVCDIAAGARSTPVTVTLAGRNRERLDWLVTAANARAEIFGSAARFAGVLADLQAPDAATEAIVRCRPALVVQAASAQAGAVIAATGDAWSRLVAQGGYSATAVFQALFSVRVARAVQAAAPSARFINCCFPDVVNGIIAALGLPVACGVGNIQILSSAFAGAVGPGGLARVKVLGHYQVIGAWRRRREERVGMPVPRVWIDGVEVVDVPARFAGVRLTPEPALEISGSGGVPLMLAMATHSPEFHGHAPGPLGLPGGYPVVWRGGALALDLPAGVTREAAIAYNARPEEECGLVVGADGVAHYTGRLRELLRSASPDLAEGFAVRDLEAVHEAMVELRRRLQAEA